MVWLTLDPVDPVLELTPTDDNRHLQTYLDDGEYWMYDSEGVRKQRLTTSHARRYTDHPTIYLDTLHLDGNDQQGHHWQLSAGAGELLPGSNQLKLRHNVELLQADRRSRLVTDNLVVDTEKQTASTEAPVTITFQSSITTAQGLNVNLPAGTGELLKDVETIYDVQ